MRQLIQELELGSVEGPTELVSRLNPKASSEWRAKLLKFAQYADALYFQADQKRDRARSWRSFRVGCGALAYRAHAWDLASFWEWDYGINSKAAENGRNICAEPVAIDGLLTTGVTEIVGMVIVGPPQPDILGPHRTLQSCAHCLAFMHEHPLVLPETVIVTARPPTEETEGLCAENCEVHTFAELAQKYRVA